MNKYFWSAVSLSLVIIFFREPLFIEQVPVKNKSEMLRAIELTKQWKKIVNENKRRLGIPADSDSLEYAKLNNGEEDIIGDEYSILTTTLGSLEAKELSNNTAFSALMVKLISESDADTSKPVGIEASGSFPALTIQTMAALQSMNRKAVLISSLGASSHGANQPGALWIDMEGWLNKYGGCRYHSELITYGAEGDTAGGLIEEGKAELDNALTRNGKQVFIPKTIEMSIEKKLELFKGRNIGLLINIGGNQSALGYCSHAELLPNGLHKEIVTCDHKDRGVISRVSEIGIPFIHLLNLKNLAAKYSITDRSISSTHPIFMETKSIKWRVLISLLLISVLLFQFYRSKKSTTK